MSEYGRETNISSKRRKRIENQKNRKATEEKIKRIENQKKRKSKESKIKRIENQKKGKAKGIKIKRIESFFKKTKYFKKNTQLHMMHVHTSKLLLESLCCNKSDIPMAL